MRRSEATLHTHLTEDKANMAQPLDSGSPPHSDWQLLQRFSHYLKPHWKGILVALSSIPFTVGSTFILPWLIQHIWDDYLVVLKVDGLLFMVGLLAGTVLLGYIADSFYTFSLQKVGQLAIFSMRQDLFQHVLTLPRKYFDHHPVGVILTRLTSDMEALGESMAVGVLSILTDVLKTLALLIMLFYLSWELTLVLMLVMPLIYGVSDFLRSRLRQSYNLSRQALADSTSFLQECLNGIKTVQLYAAESNVQQQYKEKTGKFLHAQTRSNIYDSSLFSVIEGITSIALALLIWYGARKNLEGQLSIGIIVSFIDAVPRIFVPIRNFTQEISTFQRSMASMEHIDQLFCEGSETNPPTLNPTLEQQLQAFETLEFEEVSFRYDEQGPYILKGVSFLLKKGDRIAFVGATGSGKSTIVRLITQMYPHYQGTIKLNGLDIANIPRLRVLKMISMMQQDTYLFEETVQFNIALNRPGISSEDVIQAARYVYADTFIEQWPEAYDALISEGGTNLSAGQAQLIAFARAIAGKSELIVLDEATSAVDSITENFIEKAIEKVFHEKTVIAIAHRLSTIRNSDHIFVMKEGQIVERGTHEQLIQQQGVYAQLLKTLKQE
ncbi:ABC transporter ATP-binding protein [Deltaproteobacteria bacterium TL4]